MTWDNVSILVPVYKQMRIRTYPQPFSTAIWDIICDYLKSDIVEHPDGFELIYRGGRYFEVRFDKNGNVITENCRSM